MVPPTQELGDPDLQFVPLPQPFRFIQKIFEEDILSRVQLVLDKAARDREAGTFYTAETFPADLYDECDSTATLTVEASPRPLARLPGIGVLLQTSSVPTGFTVLSGDGSLHAVELEVPTPTTGTTKAQQQAAVESPSSRTEIVVGSAAAVRRKGDYVVLAVWKPAAESGKASVGLQDEKKASSAGLLTLSAMQTQDLSVKKYVDISTGRGKVRQLEISADLSAVVLSYEESGVELLRLEVIDSVAVSSALPQDVRVEKLELQFGTLGESLPLLLLMSISQLIPFLSRPPPPFSPFPPCLCDETSFKH